MGKNKKKFIDKKNASRYHLMHRSQRDVGGEMVEDGAEVGTGGMILWPDPSNNPDTDRKVLAASDEQVDKMREWKQKLSQVGLLDEYDEQYLKPITGAGTFLSAQGKVEEAAKDARAKNVSEDMLAEVNQKFEGIPLATDCMDEDMEQALMGDFEEADFEEIQDDFVFEAAKEPEAGDTDAFDFDSHIQKLMKEARLRAMDRVGPVEGHDWGAKDQDFFSGAKALHAVGEGDDEDDSLFGTGATLDVTPGVVPSLNPDAERALCEQFEQALADYDSDEVGDILEEEVQGNLPLEGDAKVEAALDDFLQEKDDDVFMQGKTPEQFAAIKAGGSGFSALVGTRMVPIKELDKLDVSEIAKELQPISEVLKEAKKKIQSPELEPPPEEIFIDGKSYYSVKDRNPWDCESILSTYSNLDNNPAMIGNTSRRKKKNNKAMQKIILSSKTGLPIENPVEVDEDSDEDDYDDTYASVNRGVARKKQETKEEKRARKAQVKKERQVARIQKKVTREVYKDEFINRSAQGTTDDVAGMAVFRYS